MWLLVNVLDLHPEAEFLGQRSTYVLFWLPRWLSGKRIHLKMQETLQMQGWEDPLEEGMDIHSKDLNPSLIPGSGRSPGGGNGNPLQYSCLEKNPMNRGAWWATLHGMAKSWTWLSDWSMHPCTFYFSRSCQKVFQSDGNSWSSHQFWLFHICTNPWYFCLFHFSLCIVIWHCGFNLHFSDY